MHGATAAGLRASGRGTDINQFFMMERYGLRTGDTVMVAIDAGRGRIYYGINGRWLNGQPGGAGGEALDTGKILDGPRLPTRERTSGRDDAAMADQSGYPGIPARPAGRVPRLHHGGLAGPADAADRPFEPPPATGQPLCPTGTAEHRV